MAETEIQVCGRRFKTMDDFVRAIKTEEAAERREATQKAQAQEAEPDGRLDAGELFDKETLENWERYRDL